MVPGDTLNSYKKEIEAFIRNNNPFIITVNFVTEAYKSAVFFGNQKRYNNKSNNKVTAIISSNVKSNNKNDIIVNYESLIMRGGKYFENSTIMLLNLLRRVGIGNLFIAGFDGYAAGKANFITRELDIKRFESEYDLVNAEIRNMFGRYVRTVSNKCKIRFITPSMFESPLTDSVKNQAEGR